MLMEVDGRLSVVSVAEPEYALYTVQLDDGRTLSIKEDIRETPEYRSVMKMTGLPILPHLQSGPRFYVTAITLPSGEKIKPTDTKLPDVLRLHDGREIARNGRVIDDYVCYAPSDK